MGLGSGMGLAEGRVGGERNTVWPGLKRTCTVSQQARFSDKAGSDARPGFSLGN